MDCGYSLKPPHKCNNAIKISIIVKHPVQMEMGKPTICICENKGIDQLRGNREADQRLCFRYSDSTIPPLRNPKISSFQPASVLVQTGLCRTCSETTLLVFPRDGSYAISIGHSSSSYPFYSLLSSTEGWTCLTSLLLRRPLHSDRFCGSAVSIPSFFLSSNNTSSHDFLGLLDFLGLPV